MTAESHAARLDARARIELTAGRARDAWRHYAGAAGLLEATRPAAGVRARSLAPRSPRWSPATTTTPSRWPPQHARRSTTDSEAMAGPISALILGYSLWRSGSTAEGVSLLIPAAELAEHADPDRAGV